MALSGRKFFEARYGSFGVELVDVKPKQCIRLNSLKDVDVLSRLRTLGVRLESVSFLDNGFYVLESGFSLGAITEFLLGYYCIQSAPAQLPVKVLSPSPGDVVLDMCAAPGGKSTQLAELMENKGLLVCFELKPHRLSSLVYNLDRCGVVNSVVFRGDSVYAGKLGLKFDKILLDAPCSGNYVSDSHWFEKRDLDGIKKSSRIQKRLIRAASQFLKKDGVLVYSTCSLDPLENEFNVQWALDNLPLKLEDTGLDVGDPGLTEVFNEKFSSEIKKCRRFIPHKTGTEAFFIARFRRC